MADGIVQVPVDGGGRKIDASEQVRNDGTIVERQRIAIGGDAPANTAASVTVGVMGDGDKGELAVGGRSLDYLQGIYQLLTEIKYILETVVT